MSLRLNNLIGFGAGGPPPIKSVTLTDDPAYIQGSTTARTFSSVSLGAAEAERWIVVGASATGNATDAAITSITIGGVACTLYATVVGGGAGINGGCSIGILKVPAGVTADIIVSCASTQDRYKIGVWAVIAPSGDLTVVDSSGVAAESTSVNTEARGAVIARTANTVAGTDIVWTNATEVFEEQGGSFERYGGAQNFPLASTASLTVTANGGGNGALSLVSLE